MTVIYVHIPFCRKACHYCDFHFSTNLNLVEKMADALAEEGRLWADAWAAQGPLKTLYLGGGTPSILPAETLGRMLEGLRSSYDLSAITELTLEANPDDVTPEMAQAWRALGITRVSLGVQSLNEEVLAGLNRSHTAAQALQAVAWLKEAGLPEISVDLIFGLPGQTMAGLQEDVEQMLALEVPHISLYGLTIEERTVFGRRTAKGEMREPDEGLLAEMMAWLQERLAQAGYLGYEISNYALPGHEAKHNSAYWDGVPYLGLGPAAHSFDGHQRWQNPANNTLYLKGIEAGVLPHSEPEILSPEDSFNEGLLTGLRLAKGVDVKQLAERAGVEVPASFWVEALKWQTRGSLILKGTRLFLAPAGRLLADHITAKLFL
ncbi:radical SAM family heme chaperone HemW [Nostoc sp. NIES-2111]